MGLIDDNANDLASRTHAALEVALHDLRGEEEDALAGPDGRPFVRLDLPGEFGRLHENKLGNANDTTSCVRLQEGCR